MVDIPPLETQRRRTATEIDYIIADLKDGLHRLTWHPQPYDIDGAIYRLTVAAADCANEARLLIESRDLEAKNKNVKTD
jgi:hypothetical protein